MKTAIRIFKLVIKLLLLVIFFPLLALWLLLGYWKYRIVLTRQLVKSGVPRKYAWQLAGESKKFLSFRMN